MYNHCNICNIPIYFYNIHTKYWQHTSETSETLETYAYTFAICVFSAISTCCLDDWRLVNAELNAAEWCAAPVEKTTPVEKEADVVENGTTGRWPGGEE